MTELELDAGNSKKYKVKAIRDSAIYAMKLESGHLPGFYYLEAWKGYPKKRNTWEPFSAVQHLRKLIRLLHKDYSEKPIATSLPINSVLPMARPKVNPTAKSITKRKQS